MEYALTPEMIAVLVILGFTLFLFVSEIVRVDVAAVAAMVLLGVTSYVWEVQSDGTSRLLPVSELFTGFASNAVISIIAVIIIGAGLDRTGVMSRLAGFIMKVGGKTEQRIIPLISGTVGVISSFMQNIGAAALFLPVVSRISSRTGLPMSRLLMPMGFCAILGGTMTMIGSSPLIMLNDLIIGANSSVEAAGLEPMKTFSLFDVTPIGLALVLTGIVYFVVFGRYVLPVNRSENLDGQDTVGYLSSTYGVSGEVYEVAVPSHSPLVGRTIEEVESLARHHLLVVASTHGDVARIPPARDVVVEAGTTLAFCGDLEHVRGFAAPMELELHPELLTFADQLTSSRAGVAELVIPPMSGLIGRTPTDIRMRKTYGLNMLVVHRQGESIRTGFRDLRFASGDTLLVHTTWDNLAELEKNRDFVVVTSNYPHEELRPHKVHWALLFFAIALGLALFTDMKLSLALFVGALGMIVSGVLSPDEAYKSVNWQSVFLLASLLPLGVAMTETQTAAWIAQETLALLGDVPVWVIQATIAVLATALTLAASNVGATALLVPIAVNMAIGAGADPRVFALTVAIATSNSFIIPTHQVNALIMGPAGYRVKDFMRAGGIMSILFLVVMMVMLNLVF